jgi:hypothetical protein
MAPSPYIEVLRLDSFKSLRGATLPLHDLTLLIGHGAHAPVRPSCVAAPSSPPASTNCCASSNWLNPRASPA